MAITIKRNQKIQGLQIIDNTHIRVCVCESVSVTTQIQMLKLPKYQKYIYN